MRAFLLHGSAVVLFIGAIGCGSSTSSTHGDGPGSGGSAQGGDASGQGGSAGTQAGTSGAGGSASGNGGSASGNGGSTTGGDAGTGGQPMTEESVCRAAIQAQCEVKTRCGSYSDIKLCMETAELCPEYYFSPGSARTVENVVSCLDALRNKSCDEERVGIVPTCLLPGTLADEAPCTYSTQCMSGNCSMADGASCTTCRPEAGLGESCIAFDCGPGLFCDTLTDVCTAVLTGPAAAEGEPCNITSTPFVGCQGTLGCGPTATSPTPVCHVLSGVDEPCPDALCTPPLLCAAGNTGTLVCVTRDSCNPDCDAGYTCVYQDAYTCVPIGELGDTCDVSIAPCAVGLVCKSGTCVDLRFRGETCTGGDCARGMECTDGVCSLPAPSACP